MKCNHDYERVLNRPEPTDPVGEHPMAEEDVEALNEAEVRAAVLKLGNHKAAGIDGIPAELLKHGGITLHSELFKLLRKCWEEERLPTEWEEGVYIPLHKKNDRLDCNNYRGICLLPVCYKAYTRILCQRLLPFYLNIIGQYQSGFIPEKSTIDNIFIIRQINEKYREYGKTAWHIYVDYKQAYDSVHRSSLWNILRSFSIPEKLIKLTKACYANSRGRVRVGGDLTEPFSVASGLRQGCPLSCILFNLTLEWVLRNTRRPPDPIRLTNGVECDCLAYADDADLREEGYRGIDAHVTSFDGSGKRVGLEISEGKTKAMKMAREGREEDFIDIGGLMLEEVERFKYLGSTVTASNTMEEEISLRISAGSKCSWAINDLLKSKLLSRATKLQLYVTLIRPVVTYASETWALTKEHERRLLVFEHGILRRIYGHVRDEETGEWRWRHNRELRDLSHLPPITSHIRAQRLRWAGHAARMDDDRLVKQVMLGTPFGRRPAGRPRQRWIDNVLADLRLLGVADPQRWMDAAQDRRAWRLLVHAAKSN